MDSNNNQDNQNGWGGKREGAGRPQGSTQKPRISDFITQEDTKELVELAKKGAREGSDNLLRFLLDQVFGKARQTTQIENEEPFTINVMEYYGLPKRENMVSDQIKTETLP